MVIGTVLLAVITALVPIWGLGLMALGVMTFGASRHYGDESFEKDGILTGRGGVLLSPSTGEPL